MVITSGFCCLSHLQIALGYGFGVWKIPLGDFVKTPLEPPECVSGARVLENGPIIIPALYQQFCQSLHRCV